MSSLPSFTFRPSGAELLRTIAAGTAASVGTAFLRSLVRHVAEALDAEIAFAAEVEPGSWAHARVLASHGRHGVELPEGFGFAIAGTPCELAGGQDVVTIPTGTTAAIPEDAFAARHGLDGYLAIVVQGSDGERLGRHPEDRPAPSRHGPSRPPPRHGRGRPDRGHAVRRGRRGLDRGARGGA